MIDADRGRDFCQLFNGHIAVGFGNDEIRFCRRYRLEVDIAWRKGRLREATLRRVAGPPATPVKLRYAGRVTELSVPSGAARRVAAPQFKQSPR